MKKFFLSLLVIAAVAIAFSSCAFRSSTYYIEWGWATETAEGIDTTTVLDGTQTAYSETFIYYINKQCTSLYNGHGSGHAIVKGLATPKEMRMFATLRAAKAIEDTNQRLYDSKVAIPEGQVFRVKYRISAEEGFIVYDFLITSKDIVETQPDTEETTK